MQVLSSATHPLLVISIPFASILSQLHEIALFLNSRGLTDGWDTFPVVLNGRQLSWSRVLFVVPSPLSHSQHMNPIIPWNQDSALNRQLQKLFAASPYCVCLSNPCFHLCLRDAVQE